MNLSDLTLRYEEQAVFALRSLYSQYGYTQYKMQKFEEYDFYVRNKDFLISDSVITFTDTNGKLMALKPDVTLSIVKNSRSLPGYVDKLYYNENVYRVSKGTNTFREIMQVGLECIGDIDDYGISEVIALAAKSLQLLCEDSVLSLSHLGILAAALEPYRLSPETESEMIRCIEGKNQHELKALCLQHELGAAAAEYIGNFISLYGSIDTVLPRLEELSNGPRYARAVEQFRRVLNLIDDPTVRERIQIDFSVVSDTRYYNGITFKGFIRKIPGSVLSGGQYDCLMQKMSKYAGAIGFAVYLDMLDPLKEDEAAFEQDVVILYDDTADAAALKRTVDALIARGNRVSAQRALPDRLTYRQLMRFDNGEVIILEDNA